MAIQLEYVPSETPPAESEKRRKVAAAAASILDIQKRVRPDPDGWTSRDYINLGRH